MFFAPCLTSQSLLVLCSSGIAFLYLELFHYLDHCGVSLIIFFPTEMRNILDILAIAFYINYKWYLFPQLYVFIGQQTSDVGYPSV